MGLRLLATFSSSWGIEEETEGKVVWFEVRCEGGRDAFAWYADVDLDTLLDAFDDGAAGRSSPTARAVTA